MKLRKSYLFIIPLLAMFIGLVSTKNVSAFYPDYDLWFSPGDYWGCLAPLAGQYTSTAVNNDALTETCNIIVGHYNNRGCGWDPGCANTQGVMWITNSGNGATNIYDNTVVTEQSTGDIWIQLWGVFGATAYRDFPSSNYGREVKILYEPAGGGKGSANGYPAVSYLGNVPDTINRGTRYSNSPWTSGNEPANITLNIDRFREEAWSCGENCYESTVWIYRCAADGPTGDYIDSCASSPSRIRAIIPPAIRYEYDSETFSSTSYAKAGDAGWSSGGGTSTYTVEGTSDTATVKVEFEHEIKNNGGRDADIDWSISGGYSSSGTSRIYGNGTTTRSYSFYANVTKGTSRTICQTINHTQWANFMDTYRGNTLVSSEQTDRGGNVSSQACVKIRYPDKQSITQTFSSSSTAKAGPSGWSGNGGTSTYTVPDTVTSKTVSVELQFAHNITNNGSRFAVAPNYYVYRGDNKIASGTTATISPGGTVSARTDKFSINVNMGTEVTVCQTLNHNASITIKQTVLDGVAYDRSDTLSSSMASSKACATVKFPYYYADRKTEQSFTSTSQVTVDTSQGKGVRYDNNKGIYIASGVNDVSNIAIDFRHYIKNANVNTYFTRSDIAYSTGTFQRAASPQWNVKQNLDNGSATTVKNGFTVITYNENKLINNNKPLPPNNTFPVNIGTQRKICQNIAHSSKITFNDVVRSDGLTDASKDSRTKWDGTGTLSGTASSTPACVTVRYPRIFETQVTSKISNNPVYTGETATIEGTAKVTNGSAPTPPDTAIRQVSFTLVPSYTPVNDSLFNSTTTTTPDPRTTTDAQLESYFKNRFGSSNVGNFNANYSPVNGSVTVNGKTISHTAAIPDMDIGAKFCTATLINYYKNPNEDIDENIQKVWNVSGVSCSPIAKKPNFQTWNSGIYTPGSITTSTSKKTIDGVGERLFGSWSEQLVIAGGSSQGGKISGLASGATLGYENGYGFRKPGGHTNTPFKNLSPLSISNSTTTIGNSHITSDPSLLERLKARYLPETVEDVVRITSNITYPDGDYHSINDLSQRIIFAKKGIEIAPEVTQIDAWLIVENGYLNTCAVPDNNISNSTPCNRQLRINAPIFAKQLYLKRTAGADKGINSINPAEVINLRPSAYLWGYSEAQRFSEAYVTYSRELAPRY